MDSTNSYVLRYRLTPIQETAGPYVKGAVWADPDVAHLCKLLREVVENPGERHRRAAAGAKTIRREFSSAAAGNFMSKRFQTLGLDRPRLSKWLFSRHSGRPPRFLPSDVPSAMVDAVRSLPRKILISVITPVYNVGAEWLKRCIESVRLQWYPYWELCLCDDASTDRETIAVLEQYRGTDPRIKIVRNDRNGGIAIASNRAAEISTGEYLAMLDNDDEITPDCLFEIAKALNDSGDADLLYTDEDKIESDGTLSDHYFKPDFSPDHLRSVMYVLHMLVVRKEAFYAAGGFRPQYTGSQDYDLALRVTEAAAKVIHIPKVLYHWRKIPGSASATVDAKPAALENGRLALEDHLSRCDVDARVEKGKLEGLFRVRYRLSPDTSASLLIIAGDGFADVPGRGHISLVAHTAHSISEKTRYRNFELVIVADSDLSDRTRAALSGIPHTVVVHTRLPGPFNFSRKVNFAVSQAKYSHIVLLNDDLEVISAEWLESLLELTQQRNIGIAGARLLFPDNRIQHVGMAIGVNGGATHLYHGFPAEFVGYNGYTHLIRNYSAVTAACLATRKDVFESAGGFDERFAVDYNDVDFCLRVLESGRRIVYTPYAELYHFEGSSLKRAAQDAGEVALFRARWSKYLEHDPHYNPNLTRSGVDMALNPTTDWPPRNYNPVPFARRVSGS